MVRRWAARLAPWIAAACTIAVFTAAMHRRARPERQRPVDTPIIYMGENEQPQLPAAMPRYMVNLADRLGTYTVCVRMVADARGPESLLGNLPPTAHFRAVREPLVSLQVTAPAGKVAAMQAVRGFGSRLRIVLSTGEALVSTHRGAPVRFPQGVARIFFFRRPARQPAYIKSVTGSVAVAAQSGVREIPFTVRNVPFPGVNHVLGIVSASVVGKLPRARYGCGAQPGNTDVRMYADAAALDSYFPPRGAEADPLGCPTRLLLQGGLADDVNMWARDGDAIVPVAFRLHPLLGPDGEIVLSLDFVRHGEKYTASAHLWNNEPAVVALPADRVLATGRPGSVLILRLDLTEDFPPPYRLSEGSAGSAYPVSRGSRGGAVTGRVRIAGEPPEWAAIRLRVIPIDAKTGALGAGITVRTDGDINGAWRLINMQPGRYRIDAVSVRPQLSSTTTASPPAEYLRNRYGLRHPEWQDSEQEVTVRPGGITECRPMRLVEARAVVAASPPPGAKAGN